MQMLMVRESLISKVKRFSVPTLLKYCEWEPRYKGLHSLKFELKLQPTPGSWNI